MSRSRTCLALVSACCWLASGCTKPSAPASSTPAPAVEKQAATAAQPAAAPTAHAAGGHEGHACAGGHGQPGTQLTADRTTTRKGPGGETIAHVGEEFGKAPLVGVAELVANPTRYKGQKVRVQGNVASMCFHARSWFAVAASDKSGAHVRILTAPVFLVPQGAIGKRAEAEGTVDVVEQSAEATRYFANSHQLGNAEKVKGPVQAVVIRATGADFI